MKILFVCLGNICRSPMAEGIMRSKIGNRDIVVDSAGTSAFHAGDKPDHRAVQTNKKHNIDISKLVARTFVVEDFDRFDKIYAMDLNNRRDILELARNQADRDKVKLLLDEVNPGAEQPVADPYYGSGNGFETLFKMLDNATNIIIQKFDNAK